MKKDVIEGPGVILRDQYIQDITFKRYTSNSLKASDSNVNVKLSVDAVTLANEENVYEVKIYVNASSVKDGQEIFQLDVIYSGIFNVTNVEGMELELLLLVYCPSILFPFLRRIVSDITRDANFPPLMLEIIDFAKLHRDTVLQQEGNVQQ